MALTTYSPAAIIRRALDRHANSSRNFRGHRLGTRPEWSASILSGKRPLPNVLGEEWAADN